MTTPTSQPEEYDVLILGSGAAGKLLSWTFAKKGMRTAAIERKYVGGFYFPLQFPLRPSLHISFSFAGLRSVSVVAGGSTGDLIR
jgi:hypothetical protein